MGVAVYSRTFYSNSLFNSLSSAGHSGCQNFGLPSTWQKPYLHVTLQRAGCTYATRVSCGMEMRQEIYVLGWLVAWNLDTCLPGLAKHVDAFNNMDMEKPSGTVPLSLCNQEDRFHFTRLSNWDWTGVKLAYPHVFMNFPSHMNTSVSKYLYRNILLHIHKGFAEMGALKYNVTLKCGCKITFQEGDIISKSFWFK